MGITDRTVKASRSHISMKRSPKKAVPTTPKTTGDYIRLGRYEKRLDLVEIAAKLHILVSLLTAWENDTQTPDSEQRKELGGLLGLPNSIMEQANPT